MYGDGRHVSIDVVSAAFEGKNSVSRQRLVYKVGRRGGKEASPAIMGNTKYMPPVRLAGGASHARGGSRLSARSILALFHASCLGGR
jgi:hypothetical protein